MAHIIADRVSDTSTTTGAGNITVANSPPSGYETLNTVLATSDTFDYLIVNDDVLTEWEQGLATYLGSHVFARTTVKQSSNSDAAVNFSAGTKNVALVYSADRSKNPLLVSSINSGPIAGFRNAIINGAMMVAQRGAAFTSVAPAAGANNDDVYVLDRWNLLSDGNDIVDVTQATEAPTGGLNSIGLDVETVDKKFGILQVIERRNCIGLIGNTVTLSAYLKVTNATRLDKIKMAIIAWSSTADTVTSDIISAWGVDGTNPTLVANWTYENTPADLGVTTSWARYSVTAAVDTASTTNIGVFIWSDNVTDTDLGDFLHITDVQLEIGATATSFERRPFSTEYELCQRYYQTLAGAILDYDNSPSVVINGYTAFVFPVKMRAAPVTTMATPSNTNINTGGGFPTFSGMAAEGGHMQTQNSAAGRMITVWTGTHTFSAEL